MVMSLTFLFVTMDEMPDVMAHAGNPDQKLSNCALLDQLSAFFQAKSFLIMRFQAISILKIIPN
jgi:hypothetical protein